MKDPFVIFGVAFVLMVVASRVALKPATSSVVGAALGNPSGSVPFAIGAGSIGPVGGVF